MDVLAATDFFTTQVWTQGGLVTYYVLFFRVYADSCGLKTAFLGNGGRNAATIFSLRYSSSDSRRRVVAAHGFCC